MMKADSRGNTCWQQYSKGFALVSVLWGIAALALVASAVLTIGVSSKRQSAHDRELARYDALVEAGTTLAVLSLFDPDPDKRWPIDGTPRELQIDGALLRISIQDEYGKVDLNAAENRTLSKLLESIGLDGASATAVADSIVDWRDENSLRQLNGAEADDYAAAGYQYGPSNAPFDRVEDVGLVMGVTPELFRALAPFVTVYSHRPSVNPATAPRSLLAAVSASPEQLRQMEEAKSELGAFSNGIVRSGVALTNWPFTILVEVRTMQEIAYRRELVVRITDNPDKPILIHRAGSVSAAN